MGQRKAPGYVFVAKIGDYESGAESPECAEGNGTEGARYAPECPYSAPDENPASQEP